MFFALLKDFFTPVKQNDVRISDHDMLSYAGVLEGIEGHILYKKKQIKGGRFLYAYKAARRAAAEEATFLANAEEKNSTRSSTKRRARSSE